jgi:hypothetical protein
MRQFLYNHGPEGHGNFSHTNRHRTLILILFQYRLNGKYEKKTFVINKRLKVLYLNKNPYFCRPFTVAVLMVRTADV